MVNEYGVDRLTALLLGAELPELTQAQRRQIELVTARFNENLRANAVAYDEDAEDTVEKEMEYAC